MLHKKLFISIIIFSLFIIFNCDIDTDSDGIPDVEDNCDEIANPG